MLWWLSVVWWGACADPEPPPVPPVAPAPPVEKAPPAVERPPASKLYAMCEERVERPQEEGECTSDEDCVRAGCSREVCTTTEAAASMNTTCEDKLCFKVLDTCGCVEGSCRWSLLDALPESALPPVGEGGRRPQGKLPATPDGD